MEYTFGDEVKGGPLTLGMHKKGRHLDIITVDNCRLVDEDFIKVLTFSIFSIKDINRVWNNKS